MRPCQKKLGKEDSWGIQNEMPKMKISKYRKKGKEKIMKKPPVATLPGSSFCPDLNSTQEGKMETEECKMIYQNCFEADSLKQACERTAGRGKSEFKRPQQGDAL